MYVFILQELTELFQNETGFVRVVVTDLIEGSVIIDYEAIFDFVTALFTPNMTASTVTSLATVTAEEFAIDDNTGRGRQSTTDISLKFIVINNEYVTDIVNDREVVEIESE